MAANHIIPLSVPEMRGNESKYLQECIDTNWVSYVGPFVSRFEEAVAAYVGSRHAVATNSGTSALHTALLIAGVEPDDEVLVSDLTFIAPVNAIRYCGAYPVFMDVDPQYWQMDAAKVGTFLENECRQEGNTLVNKSSGRRIRALLPVHALGHPCAMDPLMALAKKHGLRVVEDAAESLGAMYNGKQVGSIGDVGIFSFNGNKIITTGGGGMVVTNNKDWAARAHYLTTQARDSAKEYIHESVGFNYRMTNLQSAIGVAQIEKLKEYVEIKRRIAKTYEEGLRSIPGLVLPQEAPWAFSTYWLYTIKIDGERYGRTSRELREKLESQGVQARSLWAPMHEQKPYRDCQAYQIETTQDLYFNALSLPCSVGLGMEDQQRVISIISGR